MKLRLPFGGVDDRDAFSEQRLGYSPDMLNIVPWDSITGRWRLSQRPGWAKFCATVIGGSKTRDIQVVSSANERLTYTSNGSSVTTEQNAATPAVSDSKNVRTDRQGNTYWLFDRTGVLKRNSAGVTVWTVRIPTDDTAHEARALFVDVDDRVYAAISTGGAQSTAKMVSWRQLADNKTELVWELALGAYVEEITGKGGKLYTVQNKPDEGLAEVVVYGNYTVADPTEIERFPTAFPANGMDAGLDGAVFVASEPTVQRGFNPKARDASPVAVDWDPTMLDRFSDRAWAWYSSRSTDEFDLVPASATAETLEGASVSAWFDRTGNGRHLISTGMGASRVAPKIRLKGSGGRPSVYFNGTTSKLISQISAGITDDFGQVGTLPGYTGAMFHLVMVVKCSEFTDTRWLFGQVDTAGNDNRFFINADADTTMPPPVSTGSCYWNEAGVGATGQGLNNQPNNFPYTSLHPWNTTAASGARNLKNNWLVISLTFTNGQAGFNSVLRINGNPVDVWTSVARTWTDGFQLGEYTTVSTGTTQAPSASVQEFQGEVMELLVLRDYRTASGVLSLIEMPGAAGTQYPNVAFAGIPQTSNTELERLEAWAAHSCGAGHVLPAGTAARLQFTGNAVAGETVTIGAKTYTWASPVGTTDGNVLVGGSAAASALNLIRAVNLSGTAGTEYGTNTSLNSSVWAFPQRFNEDADATPSVMLRSLEQTSATFVTTETMTNAAFEIDAVPTASAVSVTSLAPRATGENDGFYPHPFARNRVLNSSAQIISTGGPPRASASDYTAPSRAGLLQLPYGMIVKHGAGGRPRWVATSYATIGASGPVSLGGVGYGVRISSVGDVYSMGPRQAAIVGPGGAGVADDIDVRKIIDLGDSYSTTPNTSATTAWNDDPGAATYAYPRMAVDKYDQLWCPMSTAGEVSLIGYGKLGISTSATDNANELAEVTTLTDDPNAYAVAVDPTYPDYPTTFTNTRPRNVYLATEKTGSNNYALYKLGLVAVASATSGGAVARTYLAVNAGSIYTFTSGGTVTAVGSSVLDSNAMFITSAVFDGRVFYSDGGQKLPVYYDTRTGTVQSWTPTDGGEILPGIKFMVAHGERLFIASPTRWGCSEINDAFKWNVYPEIPTYASAADGPSSTAGRPHDPIQTLIPTNTNRLIFGCANSIRMIVGNPAVPSTQIVVITASLGMAFGPCWALDGEGTIYFMASDCGIYAMPETGGQPVPLSHQSAVNEQQASILRRLQTINLATYYAKLLWDKRNQCLHVFVCPYGAGGTIVSHYLWHKPSNAWFPVQFGATGKQPCCAFMFESDTDTGRRAAIGCEDGYVRYWDDVAKTDDGSPVEVRADIILVPDESDYEYVAQQMDVLLASNQDGCEFDFYASNVPDSWGTPQVSGNLTPGRNCVSAGPTAGAHMKVRLRNRSVVSGSNAGSRFSIESVHLELAQGAPKGVA